jgi:hypothetical protein
LWQSGNYRSVTDEEHNMAIAVRNEGSKINSNINVTTMVDVMLVLLIIFIEELFPSCQGTA